MSKTSFTTSFSCAWKGIAASFKEGRNFKVQLACALIAVILGACFRIDADEWLAVVLCIAGVLALECVNTALESLADFASLDYHALIKKAKDCAAGAVLIAALVSVVVAAIVFVPKLLACFI